DLLGEEVLVERLVREGRHARRRDEQDAIVEDPHEQHDLHLAVHVEQGRRAALPGAERLHLVAEQRVQERGTVAAGDVDDAEIGAVEHADRLAHGAILGHGIAVVARHLTHTGLGHGSFYTRARLRAVRRPAAPLRRRFQRALLTWYARHGRDLPWRRTRVPYRVLVSEIMLQQTQVERVIPKYRQFLRAYPSLRALAAADVADVRQIWYPLGYNIRPVRLHAIACEAVARYGGRLPDDGEALRALPGVGRYTAGALLSFAYGRDAAVLDTNVRRVLGRVFFGPRRLARVRGDRQFWDLA